MPKAPRKPDDGSAPPAPVLYFLVALFIGLPTLAGALEWIGVSWRSFLPYGESDNWIIAAIFAPLVIVPLVMLIVKVWQGHRAVKWQQAPGRIVKSEIGAQHHQFAGASTTVRNRPVIEYEFSVGGAKYRGARIGIADTSGSDTEPALNRYPVGQAVTVFYDPADPNDCVLEREVPKGLVSGCMIMLAVLAAGVIAFYYAVTNAERWLSGVIPEHGNAAMTVFAACFGLACIWFFFAYRNYIGQAAKWPTVPGRIATSAVERVVKREDGRDRTSYVPEVEYVYQVRGREYRSRQIKLGVEIGGSEFIAQRVAKKYPRDRAVTVRYDPQDPSTATLEIPGGYPWLILVIAAAMFGLAFFVSGFYR